MLRGEQGHRDSHRKQDDTGPGDRCLESATKSLLGSMLVAGVSDALAAIEPCPDVVDFVAGRSIVGLNQGLQAASVAALLSRDGDVPSHPRA